MRCPAFCLIWAIPNLFQYKKVGNEMSLTFNDLGVPGKIVSALESLGIQTPTPIQAATLPDSIGGRDVLGKGRTGSGKTYAFLLPIITRLINEPYRPTAGCPRTLILAPTRELVTQIEGSLDPLKAVGRFSSHTIFGGVGQGPQVKAIQRGLDIAIATPGRLEDLMKQGEVHLSEIEMVIIDEADQMADMGFLPIVTKILNAIPADAQHLLFSATLDEQVKVIVDRFLNDPITHDADGEDATEDAASQMEHHALRVAHEDKPGVIADLCAAPSRTIVFARTKHGARNLSRKLTKMGVPALELHGNLTQNARMRNLNAFHEGMITTLVATDIAARGIHVDDVELVIHADPPAEHKAYVHRSGRTARAGKAGVVVTITRNDQEKDVKSLMKKAGIDAQWANCTPDSDLLFDLAPGGRHFMERADAEALIRDVHGIKTKTEPAPNDARTGGSKGRAGHGKGEGRAHTKTKYPHGNRHKGHTKAVGPRKTVLYKVAEYDTYIPLTDIRPQTGEGRAHTGSQEQSAGHRDYGSTPKPRRTKGQFDRDHKAVAEGRERRTHKDRRSSRGFKDQHDHHRDITKGNGRRRDHGSYGYEDGAQRSSRSGGRKHTKGHADSRSFDRRDRGSMSKGKRDKRY